jgi:NADH:ubiquinone oxidoreductase subunit F (NADH-binding)
VTGGVHALLPDAPFASYAEYLAAMRGSALEVARKARPADVIAELTRSGLRGRGGAGFPTGQKWATVAQHPCPTKFAVMNAAEGEPGTFKDRFLLRKNPYAPLEGLLVAAHAVGAKQAFIAIKASFRPEIERLSRALEEMAAPGVNAALGGVKVTLVEGPEEYLFGEEKALLNVVEGSPPMPREAEKPPYEIGLFADAASPNPAVVNNVETYAHAATIVRHGADSFRALGTADTPGTILATLCGDVARPGVYEVEAGITLRQLLHEHGGGPRKGRAFKCVLSGVSAPPVLPDKFDTRCDFGSLGLLRSGLGSAGFIAVDDATPMTRVAQAVARFLYVESCNQCSACKNGLRRASHAFDELFDSGAIAADAPERAVVAATTAPQGNRCYLPVQGARLLPALVVRFAREFKDAAARPGARGPAWPIPKIVDFDEATHAFTYDSRQALKQPDWTFAEKPPPPARPPTAPVSVRIAAELADRIAAIAVREGVDLEEKVHKALHDWLAKR